MTCNMANIFLDEARHSVLQTEPNTRELFRHLAEEEFNNGNINNSVYYQVQALIKAFDNRYLKSLHTKNLNDYETNYLNNLNEWEKEDFKTNVLMEHIFKELKNSKSHQETLKCESQILKDHLILNCISHPTDGFDEVLNTCQQMPNEWTILQICKGPRPATTYNIYPKIHEGSASVYITLLKHVLNTECNTPICVKLDNAQPLEIFQKFGTLVDRFKEIIVVDPKDRPSNEVRAKYWANIKNFDCHLQNVLEDLKLFVYPWNFLFYGVSINAREKYRKLFKRIRLLCNEEVITVQDCILLSLAAFHIAKMDDQQICAISNFVSKHNLQQFNIIKNFLLDLHKKVSSESTLIEQYYPCILIVDEQLDHIFWEELNVHQEFSRVNSLQCLWRLYQHHKSNILNGYFLTNITSGSCLIDPDNNLPKTDMRMRSFFEYWMPQWNIHVAQKPSQDDMASFFQNCCYVYAGHGSGLQYINGKHIAKNNIKCVVFLFGCDSSRLHSNGLYSDLIGAHLYYHAAMCPSFVGTLMPGLDANMDGVATEILSRWIMPNSSDIVPWHEIEKVKWLREGKVCPNSKGSSNEKAYHVASLCAILSRIHQRHSETKYYNTVPYVCRGLPAWNCNIRNLPP